MKDEDEASAIKKLVMAVFRTNGALLDNADVKVRPYGLTSAQFQIIGGLGLNEVPITAPQLAKFIGISRQAVQKQLHTLLHKELIEFTPNPCHERSPLYSLSAKGKEFNLAISESHRKQMGELMKKFDISEIETAYAILNRFYEHLVSQRALLCDEECCEKMNHHPEQSIFNRI